jgi:hypothetical protein
LRSVTLQPIGNPLRILNPAMAFFAIVFTALWPLITVSSPTALSNFF